MKLFFIIMAALTAAGWFLQYPSDEALVRTLISSIIYALVAGVVIGIRSLFQKSGR